VSTRPAFRRPLALAGWPRSSWGYDDVFESYWAVRVGPEALFVTVGGLAGAVARAAGCRRPEAYLALSA
jgi:hypothetical protein